MTLNSLTVFQAASVLNRVPTLPIEEHAERLGDAIRILEKRVALLDIQQLRGAVQIAPGPQRIRGLAGTGKTVLLAMKAATIHSIYPDNSILFTFYTQSLYNQVRRLITRFYRVNNDTDPDWDKLHVRHAWGSRYQQGVYRETANLVGEEPMALTQARAIDAATPFRACCDQLLRATLPELYDFILVDEAQDLPAEFFQVLWGLCREPHRIYFAYDELQNLIAQELPDASDLFGHDSQGSPRVSLDGDYAGGMDKDLILRKSYRCPQDVLMVAHAIGLGIKGPGLVQMLPDRASWEAVGYEIESGLLETGNPVVIKRPAENSPNPIGSVYSGGQSLVSTHLFKSRDDEIEWAVGSIVRDIREEGVRHEDIVAIWFDTPRGRSMLPRIQRGLLENQIPSTVPGISDGSADFAETGRVTLTTAFRVKGNECPVVYLLASDLLHTFSEEIEYRNRAFTCISRSKGWVRISGIGVRMHRLISEIQAVKDDLPYFRFTFPDMDKIRRLGAAETTRRRQAVREADQSVKRLLEIEPSALEDLDPDALADLERRIRSIRENNGEA